VSGGRIYRNWDRASLDVQYDNRARVPDHDVHFTRWREWSAETRRDLTHHAELAYGPAPLETLDLFPAGGRGAPLFVFIHGGYWRSLDKSDFSYVARGLRPHGITTAIINYPLAPAADLDTITQETCAAIAWLWRHAEEYGADRHRIFVVGHSAGGHLATMALAADWVRLAPDLPPQVVAGASSISGIYDLEPIRLCYLNETLGMDAAMAWRNSPVRLDYPEPASFQIILGDLESEEYHRQALAMAARWSVFHGKLEVIVAEGLDHFSIMDGMNDPASDLVARVLSWSLKGR